jgi:hypothetical protein
MKGDEDFVLPLVIDRQQSSIPASSSSPSSLVGKKRFLSHYDDIVAASSQGVKPLRGTATSCTDISSLIYGVILGLDEAAEFA